ncbi:RagB/SusD family nutrient uptake outer membrane protein [Maribacter sp. 2210JD10-5]|uniref:RagB/SusD family nutrient uptake outer membrane protein n=1 Tax=Maribacter sp. 2210JD10-5 TaxID=3386272 RepID=UPI0039BD696B
MKYTYKLIKIFIVTLTIFMIGSCEDILDTSSSRIGELSEDQAFQNEQGFTSVMAAAYTELEQLDYYARDFVLIPELLADNYTLTVANRGFLNAPPNNNGHVNIWREIYRGMLSINQILSRVDNLENREFATRVEGEAKFLRALYYHDLVKSYGRNPRFLDSNIDAAQNGVPLVLTPTDLEQALELPRNSVQQVYAQIEADLNDAINFLDDSTSVLSNGSNDVFLASSVAAKALLSRVFLYQGKWEQAAQMANEAINDSGLELQDGTDLVGIYRDNSESIFVLQPDVANAFFSLAPFTTGDNVEIVLRQDMINAYEVGDMRKTQLTTEGNKSGENVTFSLKYNNYVSSQGITNIPIIRLAELILIRAEANLENASSIGNSPLNDINSIRTRAGLSELVSVTMNDILNERRVELAFEGHRFWDLKRRGLNIPKGVQGVDCQAECTVQSNDFRIVAPILNRELVINPSLIQNPGYN